ncbi:MAG: MFS transporter [Deltaproteobacteria bacterium]|nr:MFS transporter [Deltaproteobacteria bacterium]
MKVKPYRFYYGWVIVAVSFLTLFFSLGIRYSFGVFFIAILNEYGWGRAETAGAFSLAMIVHALFSPFSGYLIDRLGPRKLFPMGAILLIMGLVAVGRTTAIWHLYVFFGIVIAIGVNTLSYSPHMSIILKWFNRRRGFVMGLTLSGVGVGAMVIVPLAELMIDTAGWRNAFLLLASLVLCIVFPMTLILQRRSPEEVGQYPDGVIPQYQEDLSDQKVEFKGDITFSNMPKTWTLSEAMQTKAFWYIILAFFSNGFVSNMLLVHQAVHVVDMGYSKFLAASLVGSVGLIMSLSGIFWGFLSDRIGREITFTLGGCAAIIGILLFLLISDATSQWMLYAFVILYGLGIGSTGLMTAAAIGDLFPGSSLGRIMAIQVMGFGIGGAFGPYLAGYFHDHTGSYLIPFTLLLVSISVGIISIWIAAPRHRVSISTKQS